MRKSPQHSSFRLASLTSLRGRLSLTGAYTYNTKVAQPDALIWAHLTYAIRVARTEAPFLYCYGSLCYLFGARTPEIIIIITDNEAYS